MCTLRKINRKMKRFCAILLTLLAFLSCDRSIDRPEEPQMYRFHISAEISDSKTVLDKETLGIYWKEGDVIGLVSGDGSITPAVLDSGEGTSNATFCYEAPQMIDPEYAYYPYTGEESVTGSTLHLAMPSEQSAVYGSSIVGSGLLPMVAKNEDGSLSFTNTCSVARIRIFGTENYIRRISVSSAANCMNGPAEIDMDSDNPVLALRPSQDKDEYHTTTIVLNPAGMEGRRLHVTPKDTVTAYIVLPQGSYEGFTIETLGNMSDISVATSSETSFFRSASMPLEFNVGKIRTVVAKMEAPSSVYGRVMCGHKPLKDVVVTDGYEMTLTDQNGAYALSSEKKNALVYISIPSGYTVAKGYGAVPEFFHHTKRSAGNPERCDFSLADDGDQTNHTVLCLGDIHLVNSGNKDIEQFKSVVSDINGYVAAHPDKKIYAVQLGDSTWDMFWYTGAKFKIPDYLEQADAFDVGVFNTMGNHDGDMYETDDWKYASEFRKYLGPNYYSFNIGRYHYMVLDNVYTCNDGSGVSGRDYRFRLTDYEMDWIAKDLSYVDSSTPIVVMHHIPIFNANGNPSMSGDGNMTTSEYLAPFRNHNVVRYLCCHSHTMYNNSQVVDGKTIVENNCASVCGDFWTSGKQNKEVRMNIDGCPSGYRILEVKGETDRLTYKAVGFDQNYLFRSYDRNNMLITADRYVPSAGEYHKKAYNEYVGSFYYTLSNNLVYVYVWGMDNGWRITATENGVAKTPVEKVSQYDPLYMITSMVTQISDGKADVEGYKLNTHPVYCRNVYIYQCSSSTSPLTVTVTDRYGNSQTEVIKRPKAFEVQSYFNVPDNNKASTTPFVEDGENNI